MPDYSRYSLIEESEPVSVPLWRESLFGLDWMQLRMSPVFYGLGVPRGDRSAVITIPGFMGSDLYLTEFRWWLWRVGYRPFPSRIGRNVDCLKTSGERLLATIDQAHRITKRPVHLIGHSLGGLLARAVAGLRRETVASVTTLGSPIQSISAHPLVIGLSDAVRGGIQMRQDEEHVNPDCFSGKCTCHIVEQARVPNLEGLPLLSIYTKTDGVVHWEACLDENPDNNIEVKGTHCGLAFHADVFRHVARFLKDVKLQQLDAASKAEVPAPKLCEIDDEKASA